MLRLMRTALLLLYLTLGCAHARSSEAQLSDQAWVAARLNAVSQAAAAVDSMPLLTQLCDRIGPRLTGSAPAHAAELKLLAHMQDLGLLHVHSEAWTLERGWHRGAAEVSLVTPFALAIPVAAYGWTGSTPVHRDPVPVALVDSEAVNTHLRELVRTESAHWRGKALLLSGEPHDALQSYAQLLPLLRAATAAQAIAVLQHDSRPGAGLVHTEPIAFPLPGHIDTSLIPALDLSAEHQELLENLLRAQQPVQLHLSVANSFTSAPVTSPNLVAEIPGSTHPEQTVIVSAHLDSWDLGTGATDDGFGVAAVLGAAEAILQSGMRPARTLRFILFTGEEQGLLGSRAYVQQHAAELPHVLAAFALDWGAGTIVRFPTAGHPELVPLLTQLNTLAPQLQLQPPDNGYLSMTDAYAFTLQGLPGLAPLVRDSRYSMQAHSGLDTLDKVGPAELRQATTALATASFFVADTPEMPQTHLTPTQTAASLIAGQQQSLLETLGLWPF